MPAILESLAVGAIFLLGAAAPRSAPRHDVEVTFSAADVTLSGTLSVPGGPVRRRPVAVFVSGDGPQDRDGNPGGAGLFRVLAAEDTSIFGIAMLAGATAVNVDALLEEQAQLDPNGPAPRLLRTMARAKAGEDAQGPDDLVLWMREHLEFAPRTVLPRVRCPVLILQGDADHLVRPHHAAEAAAVIERGGNRQVTLRTFPGLSHVFNRRAPGVTASPDAARVDPTVAGTLARWAETIAPR